MDASRKIGAPASAAAAATPVNRRSDQFAEVHYMLEMALAHANVKITHLQIWDVRNPAVRVPVLLFPGFFFYFCFF